VAEYVLGSVSVSIHLFVCLPVYNHYCKQDISKTNLRIFGKFIADILYMFGK